MSANKNTLNYFPRGSKKKSTEEGQFIFNKSENVAKKRKDGNKFVVSSKKKRVKLDDKEMYDQGSEFVIGKKQIDNDLEDYKPVTNKIPSFKPSKGSLILMWVNKVIGDKWLILNHTRNRKGFMPATNGKIFGKKVGDFVYGVVVGTSIRESDNTQLKRSYKLEITDNLNIYNTFLSADKLQKGMQLQGIVESREDKGYMINLRLKDESKAFLNYSDYKGKELNEGDEISVILKGSKSKSQKIIKWIHRSAIENFTEWKVDLNTEVNFEWVKPGFLVEAKIEGTVEAHPSKSSTSTKNGSQKASNKTSCNGLNVTFGKGVNGVIFVDHLQHDLSKYKKNKKILARVIYVDFEKKLIGLSELEHILNLTPSSTDLTSDEILNNVKIVRKVYGNSYEVEAEKASTGDKVRWFFHKNHIIEVSNEKDAKNKSKEYLDFKAKAELDVGQNLEYDLRVKEFNYFDAIPIVLPLHDKLGGSSINWNTLRGGVTIEGTIKDISEEDFVVVEINNFITGRIYRTHLTDVPQNRISKKIKNSIGKKMTFKIWKAIQDKKVLELTKKESILKDKVFVPTSFDDPRVKNGVKLTGVAIAKNDQGIIVEYFNNIKGFLPFESLEKYNKKYAFNKGDMIEAYMLFKANKGLSLTISEEESVNFKAKVGGGRGDKQGSQNLLPKDKELKVGEKVNALIYKFNKQWSCPLIVKLTENKFGFIMFSDLCFKGLNTEEDIYSKYKPGKMIDVYVKSITPSKIKDVKIECTLVNPNEKVTHKVYKNGDKVICRFVKFKSGFGATVQLSGNKFGFVDICEIDDYINSRVDVILKNKSIFYGRIIDDSLGNVLISTRDSMVDDQKYKILGSDGTSLEFKKMFGEAQKQGDIRNLIVKYHNWRELININMLVRGYVTSVNQHGVFIKLARNLSVRAALREINDDSTVTADSMFVQNTMILGRILKFNKDKIDITLRDSILLYGIDEIDISEIHPGFKAKLYVLSVASQVAFCQVIGSRFKWKVKLTKDDPEVKVGQKIVARIKAVTKDTPPKIMMHEVELCNEEPNEEFKEITNLIHKVKNVQEVDLHEMKIDEVKEKDDEVHINQNEIEQNIEDLQELLEAGEDSDDEMDEEAKKITKFLKFDEGGESSDDLPIQSNDGDESDMDHEAQESEIEEAEGDGEEDKQDSSKKQEESKKTKAKSMNDHIQEEINIMLKERGITGEEHDDSYFEQMLIANPNNSFIWTHYISHWLSKKGYKEAKVLWERAVKTIDITNLREKLNLWIAYMNFESKFGKEKEFQSVVKRALKVNDQREVYIAVIDIYLKRKSYKIIEGIYVILSRKYKFDVDIWKRYIEYLFTAQKIKDDESNEDHILLVDVELSEKEKVLSRALQILDRKDQIELIRKYAIEEYKQGNIEKGRTMFESIIHSYPKRTDK